MIFFNNMQILHLFYFNNLIGVKSTGPFQVPFIPLQEWEVGESKSIFIGKKESKAGGSTVPYVQQMLLKGNFN